MLEVDNLCFQYPRSEQLFQFTLSAGSGEIVGIMGRSGSGKSTFFDLLAGFLVPHSGSMRWDGADFALLVPHKRPITILFQTNNLFEHLSVRDNVALGFSANLSPTMDQLLEIEATLEKMGLSGEIEKRSDRLSGGQIQRVALARSLVRKRPVLLLDEPFTGLDDHTKEEMYGLIRNIATNEQMCVLMITHDQNDCDAIADRKYLLKNAQLTEDMNFRQATKINPDRKP